VYDTIRNFKKEDGMLLCDSFIRAPKRRQEPTYYDVTNLLFLFIIDNYVHFIFFISILQVVSNPIDLIKIQQKIKTDEYDDVDDLQADLELLTNNAKSFYKVIIFTYFRFYTQVITNGIYITFKFSSLIIAYSF